MQNIPPSIRAEIQEAVCRPEGTVSFEYHSKELFDHNVKGGILFEIPSGGHLFRLERDDNLVLYFYHTSPGTGTRVAKVDLKEATPAEKVFMAFTWSPVEIALHVGPRAQNAELYSAIGKNSERQFRVGIDGSIFQVGDNGLEVMGVSIFHEGVPVLQPTAKDAWKETLKATEILATGESNQGYIYEVVVTNLSLAILVSGFEAYTKKRLLEIESEGITPNTGNLVDSFFPKKERDAGIFNILAEEAKEQNKTVLKLIDERNIINFQSFQKCKLAYNKAYNIKFGELNLPQNTIERVQKFIKYRHRIIHVSPSIGMLNQAEVPPEEPVFPKKELAQEARLVFDQFIDELHRVTLTLKPVN
ncbi:MAG: hypothetical protein PHN84_07860 [Desulfuromonadaceae bacterium]|nr:hypothetical protein [Desulfuromonadaceae bacterium]MDD2854746.1 hypothetical protein [Desulfuromonadaceae bacterium]